MSRRWRAFGAPIRAQRRRKRSDRAIGQIVELQRSDGSFGVWSDTGDTVPWLDAYATDFLLRAKEHGKNVPISRSKRRSAGCATTSARCTAKSASCLG